MAGECIMLRAMTSRRHWLSTSCTSFSRWRYFASVKMFPSSQRFNAFQVENKPNDDSRQKDKKEKAWAPQISLVTRKLLQLQSQPHDVRSPSEGSALLRGTTANDVTTNSFKTRLQTMTDDAESTVSSMGDLVQEETDVDSASDLENAIELIAFQQDFQTPKKFSPLHGTEDASVEPSRVPCTGCGAHLQCHNRTLPGFMVSEQFKLLTERELKRSICQRCYYMQHCNAFVEAKTEPEEYTEMISKIRPTRSLVVIVVDLMDMQGSIVPNLTDYIGHKHPLLVVGNKADLLAPDCPEYLRNAQERLKEACRHSGLKNVKAFNLISAKTGFGMEKLISTLFSFYRRKVDVYIVGTANSGKSSLFNILLSSDYCKHTARDLIQRATVSEWPGTTLNLLKFPIMRHSSKTAALRFKRLKQEKALRLESEKIAREQRKHNRHNRRWELTDDVNTTDVRTAAQIEGDEEGVAWGQNVVSFQGRNDGSFNIADKSEEQSEFKSEEFDESYWVYDTPGIINPDQIMNLLSPDECTQLTPSSMIIPRAVVLQPQQTIFISGLARIDYLKADVPLFLTVHSSSALPIRIGPTVEADGYYEQYVGSETLLLPMADKQKLSKLPSLAARDFVVKGRGTLEAAADVQLSSVGWVSVAAKPDIEVTLRAYTPGAKGLHLRQPSLLPQFSHFRGKRISGTPFYKTTPPGSAMSGKNLMRLGETWDDGIKN
ncbi:nitric oxide synthase-like protein [Aplysia californica]|uniref:Nitric oxide synthase-like protein n=1 Tax=Aplysia californica TaxID=6500 RepID=A8QJ65_APLCA|nr:nitric oxide synthase-like protein [Aplysia californica]ABN05382.1 nitric oxide synthase-like protein [Aplysia californica]